VIGVVAYRASVYGALVSSSNSSARNNAKILTSLTAALLNLVRHELILFLLFFFCQMKT